MRHKLSYTFIEGCSARSIETELIAKGRIRVNKVDRSKPGNEKDKQGG